MNKAMKNSIMTDATDIAVEALRIYGKQGECPVDIFAIARNMGMHVTLKSLSGYHVSVTRLGQAHILLNKNLSYSQQRVLCAKAVGRITEHLTNGGQVLDHHDKEDDESQSRLTFINAFAQEILMPSFVMVSEEKAIYFDVPQSFV